MIGVLNAYFWSDKFVFTKGEGEKRNKVKILLKTYIVYGTTGIFLSSLLLFFLIERSGLSEYIAQVICLLITVPINYVLNKYWSFK